MERRKRATHPSGDRVATEIPESRSLPMFIAQVQAANIAEYRAIVPQLSRTSGLTFVFSGTIALLQKSRSADSGAAMRSWIGRSLR
jgi:replicative DNA helicase